LFSSSLIFLLLFWPSLIFHHEKSFLAVHWCTARELADRYGESEENVKSSKRETVESEPM
jgi:hypothetical protein